MKKRADGLYQKKITINGKPKVFYGKTVSEINKKILEYQGDIEHGRTFAAIANEWSSVHFEKIEHNTLKQYKPALREAIDEFGKENAKNITALEIERFLYRYAKQGYAKKTVKTRLLVLNLIFKYAVIHGDCDSNPCQYVSVDKNLKQSTRQLPTNSDISIINRSIDCTFGLFAYFLLYTGCRRAEVLALRWSDIDFDNKIITINKSLYWLGNIPHCKKPKTEAGTRTIVLLDTLSDVLKKTMQQQKNVQVIFFFPTPTVSICTMQM